MFRILFFKYSSFSSATAEEAAAAATIQNQ